MKKLRPRKDTGFVMGLEWLWSPTRLDMALASSPKLADAQDPHLVDHDNNACFTGLLFNDYMR